MSANLPAEIIPIIVTLWMNLHTATRRELIADGVCDLSSLVNCPKCEDYITVDVYSDGRVDGCCNHDCGWKVSTTIDQLMPSAPNGVGIADYEVRK